MWVPEVSVGWVWVWVVGQKGNSGFRVSGFRVWVQGLGFKFKFKFKFKV